MHEGIASRGNGKTPDWNRSRSFLCLSKICLGVSLCLTNSVNKIKHAWNLGWLGCVVALAIFCVSPNSRTRADAAKVFGMGICVAFYVMKCGHGSLLCRVIIFCDMPLEVLAFATFCIFQSWVWLENVRKDKRQKQIGAAVPVGPAEGVESPGPL